MKKTILLFSIILLFSGCKKEKSVLNNIDSLSTYWDFQIFGDEGRGITFEFYDNEKRAKEYELNFEYSILNQDILIELTNVTYKGKCAKFPNEDDECLSKGRIFIPESDLPKGNYNLILKTKSFEVASEFSFDNIKYTLSIPSNDFLSSSYTESYPMPKNILLGSIVYSGNNNTPSAKDFIDELNSLGFLNTIVPNFDKIPMNNVDSNGVPIERNWSPDNYSLSFVCIMSDNFREAYDVAENYFNANDINIYIYSSNGDQARLDKTEGITTVFKK